MKNKKTSIKIIFSLLAVVFFGVLMYKNTVSNIEIAWKVISADELTKRLPPNNFILLDVRQPNEYNSGHIPGAISIPLNELDNKIGTLNSDKEIIVYCLSGKRSSRAASKLYSYGFNNILNYVGGIKEWTGPLEN